MLTFQRFDMFAKLHVKLDGPLGAARDHHVRCNLAELWVAFNTHDWVGLRCVWWNFRQSDSNKSSASNINNLKVMHSQHKHTHFTATEYRLNPIFTCTVRF